MLSWMNQFIDNNPVILNLQAKTGEHVVEVDIHTRKARERVVKGERAVEVESANKVKERKVRVN